MKSFVLSRKIILRIFFKCVTFASFVSYDSIIIWLYTWFFMKLILFLEIGYEIIILCGIAFDERLDTLCNLT